MTANNVKIFETEEVQNFINLLSGLEQEGGNPRTKQIIHRVVSDLFKTIEDLIYESAISKEGNEMEKMWMNSTDLISSKEKEVGSNLSKSTLAHRPLSSLFSIFNCYSKFVKSIANKVTCCKIFILLSTASNLKQHLHHTI